MVVGKWPPPTLSAVALSSVLVARMTARTNGFLFSRDFQNLKFLQFSKIRILSTLLIYFNLSLRTFFFFCQIANSFIGQSVIILVINKMGLPLRGRPILLSLVWLQTELDSTQSYYHYLLHTQIIMSDLRSARKIWTALILRKINLRAAKSWFDSPSLRCWSSLTVPSCQTRETEIETHSVFFDWLENGR